MSPPGARLESWAPRNAPGIAPSSSDDVMASEKLAEQEVAERRRADERDRLREVRADERRGLEAG